MKVHGRLLIVALICFSFNLFSQSSDVSQKASKLVELFETEHVQPREINDVFGESVHQNLLNNVDADHDFFTQEELGQLLEKSKQIDDDIAGFGTSYLDLFKTIFFSNLEQANSIQKKLFSAKIDITKKINSDLLKDSILTSTNFENYWTLEYRNSIQAAVLGELESVEYNTPDDSLDLIISESTTLIKNSYQDYFKNLVLDSAFIENQYLNAIAQSFDSHSAYFTASQNESYNEELSSERELFGISYVKNLNGIFEITNIHPGSSAWLSGEIHVGDELLKLQFGDEKPIKVEGKTNFEVHQAFSETDSKNLQITLRSNGEVKTVSLVKSKVYSDSDIIKSAILEGEEKVGYIALPDFYANWTDTSALGCANDLAKALIKLKKENIQGVILDLRDNGGGSLFEAVDLVGTFIDYGPVLVVKDNDEDIRTFKDFNRGAIYRGPLIVLINEYSASASEVVAGAIQDYNRGLIVGQTSFGKATGQNVQPLTLDESSEVEGFAKITGIGLYRINLETNQINGVIPDVPLESLVSYDYPREEDYPNVLSLESIEKKMYYTPKKEINTERLIQNVKMRTAADVKRSECLLLIDQLESKYDQIDYYNQSLKEIISYSKEAQVIEDKLYETLSDWDQNFKPVTNQFDAEIYRMNSYLNSYNEDFHERIKNDFELGETYQIMLDLIQQNK